MRYAALIFGLVAGALGLWLGLVARDATGFSLARAGVLERMLILVGLFIVPAISVVGAIFALINLRVAAAAMIASAMGWLGIGLLTGNSVTPMTGAAMLLSAIGGIWAVLALVLGSDRQDDRYDVSFPRGGARSSGRQALFAGDDAYEGRREPAMGHQREEPSFEPSFGASARGESPDPYDRRFSSSPLGRLAAQHGGRSQLQPQPARPSGFLRGSTFMRFAAFGQALAAVAVIGGIGSLLVYDYLRGPSSLLFANYFIERPAAAAPADRQQSQQPSATVASAPAARTVEPERLLPRPPPALVPPAVVFDDPVAYCVAMATDHHPDVNAVRQGLSEDLVRTLRQVRGDMNAAVRWRCADKRLYVCVEVGGPVCEMTPDTDALATYCAANPGARNVRVPAGAFDCEGTRPVVPAEQSWPTDRYGFLPRAWVAASPG